MGAKEGRWLQRSREREWRLLLETWKSLVVLIKSSFSGAVGTEEVQVRQPEDRRWGLRTWMQCKQKVLLRHLSVKQHKNGDGRIRGCRVEGNCNRYASQTIQYKVKSDD